MKKGKKTRHLKWKWNCFILDLQWGWVITDLEDEGCRQNVKTTGGLIISRRRQDSFQPWLCPQKKGRVWWEVVTFPDFAAISQSHRSSHPGARAELIRVHSSSHPGQIQIYCAHGNKNIVCSIRWRVTLSLLRPTSKHTQMMAAAVSVTRDQCILNTA